MPRRNSTSDGGTTRARRLILSVCGRGGHGKNHFAFSAPRPIRCLTIDPSTRDCLDQMEEAGEDVSGIELVEFAAPAPSFWGDTKRVQADAKDQWEKFLEENEDILGKKVEARTVIWDTSTELYDTALQSDFGKTDQLMYYQRAVTNRVFSRVLDAYRATDLNLILLHRLKEQWVEETKKVRVRGGGTENRADRVRSGEWEREGFKKIEYLIQAEVHVLKRDAEEEDEDLSNRFGMRVVKCTRTPSLEGTEWWGTTAKGRNKVTFPWLAQAIYPGTTREDWV